MNAELHYSLSPLAKQALNNGIPLTWQIQIQLKKTRLLWDNTIKEINLRYQLKNHALLNLYSIKNLDNSSNEMFSSLTSAIHNLSKIRQLKLIETSQLETLNNYYLAIKIHFIHEALPTPLRPLSYFNSQWALSSDWTSWPLKN